MTAAPAVAIVGYPNVGKSTLLNRLAGRRETVTHAAAGVTRDRKEVEAEWAGVSLRLVDTGGIDLADPDQLAADVRRQAQLAVAEASAVILVVDGSAGLRAGDAEAAAMLRGAPVPVLVAVNKLDTPGSEWAAAEFHALGLGEPVAVSALHGLGTGDLLDAVVRRLPEPTASAEPEPEGPPRIAVVGRPNVGKSSLVNRFCGVERVIVSALPGTTRDAVDTGLEVDGRPVVLVDTAGLRRRGRHEEIERYAQLRTLDAARRADVAMVVCDATEGVRSDDLRAADVAMKAGCATLVVLNKWDVTATDLREAQARIERKLRQRPPVLTSSARTGRNARKLLLEALRLADAAGERVATSELNRFLGQLTAERPPPQRRGRRLRALYMVQTRRRPPRFQVHVNDRRLVTRDWAYFLENRLRDRYDLQGIPLVVDFVPRRER